MKFTKFGVSILFILLAGNSYAETYLCNLTKTPETTRTPESIGSAEVDTSQPPHVFRFIEIEGLQFQVWCHGYGENRILECAFDGGSEYPFARSSVPTDSSGLNLDVRTGSASYSLSCSKN